MKRPILKLFYVLLLVLGACTFEFAPGDYPTCVDGGCREGCLCLGGKICVPENRDAGLDLCAGESSAVDKTYCGDEVVDLETNPQHCGSCEHRCDFRNAEAFCDNGRCRMGACNQGSADCDEDSTSGCESDSQTDVNNCGSCGNDCFRTFSASGGHPKDVACVGGQCIVLACAQGFGNCDKTADGSCETDLRADPKNCGDCSALCAAPVPFCEDANYLAVFLPVCAGSQCQESNRTSLLCPGGCSAGKCQSAGCSDSGCANPGQTCCSAICVDLHTGVEHCGKCGRNCNALPNVLGATCAGGSCLIVSCATEDWVDCNTDPLDGCEADMHLPQTCGTCTTVCEDPTPNCCIPHICCP